MKDNPSPDTERDLPPDVQKFWDELQQPDELIPARASDLDLQQLIADLHESDINVGLQSFAACGLRVWIGDRVNGRLAVGGVASNDGGWETRGAVALWIHEKALEHYPDSAYSRRHA